MKLKAIIIFIGITICAISQAFCEDAADWLKVETNNFTVEYQPSVSLKTVAARLNARGFFSSGFFGSGSSSAVTPEEEVAQRLDRLLKRAEELLDMYPPKLKITIKIFADSNSLNDAYFKMFGTHPDYKAFHIYQYQTIYTSEETISDSVIIHEMGHAIVDNYFSTNPPPKVSELLATYVDMHLED